jgi:hypothetical protein
MNVGGSTWYSLPPLPDGRATGVIAANVDGGAVVATDVYGQPWAWDWNDGSGAWVVIGGAGSQFAAFNGNLLGLTSNSAAVYEYAGSQFGTTGQSWSFVASTSSQFAQIVSGPDGTHGY